MIGLVVATHSRLAEELLHAAEMIVGPVMEARAVSVRREDSVEAIRGAVASAIEEVGRDGDGVLILTDMFGGTPSNISLSFLEPDRVEVLSGVNLPMMLKFFHNQEAPSLAELAVMLKAYGTQGIVLASELLKP